MDTAAQSRRLVFDQARRRTIEVQRHGLSPIAAKIDSRNRVSNQAMIHVIGASVRTPRDDGIRLHRFNECRNIVQHGTHVRDVPAVTLCSPELVVIIEVHEFDAEFFRGTLHFLSAHRS